MTELVRARAQHPEIPVVGVPLGGLPAGSAATPPITTYRTTASALRALGRSVRYAEWLADESEPPQPSDPARLVAARERVRATLAGVDSRWLDASPER